MRRAAVLGAALLSLLCVRQAAADAGDADALVKHGLLLRREGKDTAALAEFRRAYELQPSPRNLAQIALAEQALGRWLEAEADLAKALSASDDPWIARNRDLLESGLQNIRSRLGWLEVTVDAPGAELWLNDARVGTLPLAQPIRIEAGSAVVEVRAAGYAPARRITAVEPGGSAREAVHMVPLPPAPSATGEAARADLEVRSSRMRLVPADAPMRDAGYVVAAAGLLGLGAGAHFGVLTVQRKNDRDRVCAADSCNGNAQGLVFDEEARTFAVQSTAWVGAGVIALGTGVTLLWVSRSHSVREPAAALGMAPDVGPDRAGLQLRGSW